jgi:hypothetical protein
MSSPRQKLCPAADGTMHKSWADADRHDGKTDLTKIVQGWIVDADPNEETTAIPAEDAWDVAVYIADQLVSDPTAVLGAMRKAGVRLTKPRAKRSLPTAAEVHGILAPRRGRKTGG